MTQLAISIAQQMQFLIKVFLGNHIFAAVFIWILFLVYLLSTWFAWKIFREFEEKYWKPGRRDELPGSAWVKPDDA